MRLLSLHGKGDMFIAVIRRIAFYATFWVHGRVFNIMKVLYLDLCLKIRYTFLIDCGVTCLRGFHLSLQ